MNSRGTALAPCPRKDGLVIRELSDELLIYDRHRNKAYCLNKTAALIWKLCDGEASVSQMRMQLEEQLAAPVDERVIWLAVGQFAKEHLLEDKLKRPMKIARMSRRDLIQRIGLAASMPLVVSVVAPDVFAAASCTQTCIFVGNCTVPGCQAACKMGVCSATA